MPPHAPPNGSADTVTVLIIDPHTGARRALGALLVAEPGIMLIGAVSGIEEGLRAARTRRPRVTLLDAAALGPRGLAGIAALRAARTAVVVIAVAGDALLDREVLRAGASARVLKHAPAEELVAAVRAAGARRLRVVRSER